MIRAIRLILQCSKWMSFWCTVMIVIRGVLPLALLAVMKMMVDVCIEQIQQNEVCWPVLSMAIVKFAVVYVLNMLTASVYQILREHHGAIVSEYVQNQLMEKSIGMPYGYFESPKYQDVYYRAVVENHGKALSVFYTFLSVLQQGITLSLFAVVLVRLQWYVPFIIVVSSIPLVLARVYNQRRMFNLRRTLTQDERKLGYYGRVITQMEFAKELRAFKLGELFRNRYVDLQLKLRRLREKELVQGIGRQMFCQLFGLGGLVCVAYLVVVGSISGDLTIGDVAMFMLAIQRCSQVGQDLMSNIAALSDSGYFLRNLFEFLDLPLPAAKEPNDDTGNPIAVELKDVTFKYPTSERGVFEGFNLTVKRGETVAIKGGNGSGKSTLVKLICGMYEPDSGSVAVRGKVSAIFQDFMLYNTTAAENIWFGNSRKEASVDGLRDSAEQAGMKELIESLPKGYDTMLGVLFDDSEMLSQGQWQRLALARMFFADTPIVVLDEPTAALDSEIKQDLCQNFRRIVEGRTAIIISHDPEVLQLADRIVEL